MIKKLNTPFYLTGGTAISRLFFHHRYSDDLDFFVNADNNFLRYLKKIIDQLKIYCKTNDLFFLEKKTIITETFGQCFIQRQETILKLDFVNDIPERFGKIIKTEKFGKIDSLLNILSNKISALFRHEPKDIVDIWIIAKNTNFNWKEIIFQAKEKELGIDPIISAEIIQTFPIEKLEVINWSRKFNFTEIINDLKIISKEIILGADNSLCKTNIKIQDAKPIL